MRPAIRLSFSMILLVLLVALASFASPESAPASSPEAVINERTNLYLEAAKKPLNQFASQIYRVAVDSERCRMTSGAKACGLSSEPLKTGSVDDVFKYYVEQPVEAFLKRQKVETRKSDWTWQSSAAGVQHAANK